MQIARQVFSIETGENGLLFFQDNTPAYIIRRFDIAPDGTKIKQEDFASLLGKTSLTHGGSFKYTGSYEDIATCIKRYVAAWQAEMAKFFKLVVFNYLFCSSDAHLKTFLCSKPRWRLSPFSCLRFTKCLAPCKRFRFCT